MGGVGDSADIRSTGDGEWTVLLVMMYETGTDEISRTAYKGVKYTNALYICKHMNVASQTVILMDVHVSYIDTGESKICQQRVRAWKNAGDVMDSHSNTLPILHEWSW